MTNKTLLTAVMKLNGDTQESLAEAIGITIVTLNTKINGKGKFTQDEIKKISDRYNLTADEIKVIFLSDTSSLVVNNEG